ncbi:MAG TPA: HEAT repeat domain-containing protein [Myxococcaceae bacterium]|nr:HEAT repeat domain-containing protein [Myxococcaceae bacterium]
MSRREGTLRSPLMSRLGSSLVLACLAAAGCARSVGPARTTEEARARVGTLLDSPDAGAAEFAGIGPEAVPALQAELVDAQASDPRRLAAARALADLPGRAGLGVLGDAVASPRLTPALRDAVAEELGSHDREEAVARLEPLLGAADPSVRGAAARGLGRAGGAAARKSLEDRLEREEDPGVRERLQASLAQAQP